MCVCVFENRKWFFWKIIFLTDLSSPFIIVTKIKKGNSDTDIDARRKLYMQHH